MQAAVVAQLHPAEHAEAVDEGDQLQGPEPAAAAAAAGAHHHHQQQAGNLQADMLAAMAAAMNRRSPAAQLSQRQTEAIDYEAEFDELEREIVDMLAGSSDESEDPSCYWSDCKAARGYEPEEPEQQLKEPPVEEFPLSEVDAADTRAVQVAEEGRDIQGIPWTRLQFERHTYRKQRLSLYKTYTNLIPEDGCAQVRQELTQRYPQPQPGGQFFDFVRNWREVNSSIVHFQLRNLLWARSAHEVYVVNDNQVQHWHCACRQTTTVLNLQGAPRGPQLPGVGPMQVSTLCVAEDLVAAGGFTGELVVGRLGGGGPVHSCRVTQNENGITNGIEIGNSPLLGHGVLTSNNDCFVRWFDVEAWRPRYRLAFDWPVNYASLRPPCADPLAGALVAVVGDDPVTSILDLRDGKKVASLVGHKDYSFAVAWHPGGWMLATGNQDTTAMLWDMRYLLQPLAVMGGTMGAIRSLRFSPDGRYLAASEPGDFVHIYDVAGGLQHVQDIDLFGEIAGISFSPDGEAFFVAVSDVAYNSLVQYQLRRQGGMDVFPCEPWRRSPAAPAAAEASHGGDQRQRGLQAAPVVNFVDDDVMEDDNDDVPEWA